MDALHLFNCEKSVQITWHTPTTEYEEIFFSFFWCTHHSVCVCWFFECWTRCTLLHNWMWNCKELFLRLSSTWVWIRLKFYDLISLKFLYAWRSLKFIRYVCAMVEMSHVFWCAMLAESTKTKKMYRMDSSFHRFVRRFISHTKLHHVFLFISFSCWKGKIS